MGCVYSKGKAEKSDFLWISDESGGIRRDDLNYYDSCELKLTPARAGSGKVPEMSSVIGRAGMASLEMAVEVLDTLGSSMSSFNTNSGFVSGVAARGNKVSILAFEVANTIAKGANLLKSLSEENVCFMKEEVLKSDGIRDLVSADSRELMITVAADKRYELDVFSAEVIRFGNLCKDPAWHNLGRYFQTLGSELTPQEQLNEEVETVTQQLINLAQNTSELYHELHALDRFEQDYQMKLQEREAVPAGRHESLMILHSELKRQRKLVKSLKKNSLWSRNLEEVVEKLVDVVIYVHKLIVEAFGVTDTDLVKHGLVHKQRLGVSGLALHYANIINKIDNIYTVAQIKAEMQKTLRWIVPLAENTIRAHQGFGWVGEWANTCTELLHSTETNKKSALQHSITRIQTLYHADKDRTEKYILELVVWLHHLVIQVRNKGYGFNSTRTVQKNAISLKENKKERSRMSDGKTGISLALSEEDREMLERVGSNKMILGRSKSQELANGKEKGAQLTKGLSRSFGNSPSKEFSMSLELHLERTKVLDILDGLNTCS